MQNGGKKMRISPIKKLLINLAAIIIVTSIAVVGIWYMSLGAGITGQVYSFDKLPLSIKLDFDTLEVNTSAAAKSVDTYMLLENSDGDLNNVLFNVSTTFEDLNLTDSCELEDINGKPDCNLTIQFEGTTISNGNLIDIPAGSVSNVTANLSCQYLSCGQSVVSDLLFTIEE